MPELLTAQNPSPHESGFPHGRDGRGVDAPADGAPVVIPVRSEGNLPPLFCIHDGDGTACFYQSMARHLPPARPAFALESPELGAPEPGAVATVEDTACRYLETIRRIQPAGPYHLIGASFGGLLVYEIARRLLEQGEAVRFAGMVETVNPAMPCDGRGGVGSHSTLRRLWSRIAAVFRARADACVSGHSDAGAPYSGLRMLRIRESHEEARAFFRPRPLDCHLVLFKAPRAGRGGEPPADHGWTRLVRSLEIVHVPGGAGTAFDARHVATITFEIATRL